MAVMMFCLGDRKSSEPDVAVVEPVLRLPGDRLDLLADSLLSASQFATNVGPVTVRPGRLDEDAAQVRVARLGDGSAPHPLAARVLAGDRPGVAHQLSRPGEAAELPDLGHDGRGGEPCQASYGLQSLDDSADRRRRRLDRLVDRSAGVIDFGHVVEQRGIQRELLQAQRLDPVQVFQRPALDPLRRPQSSSEQELLQPMPSAQLVLLRRLWARTRSRSASCAASGTQTAVRSPLR